MGIISNGNTVIDNGAIEANEVDTTQLATDAVETAKIADANVTSAKISYPLTTFSSTGIDDNATSTAITIDSSGNVGIGTSSPSYQFSLNSNGIYSDDDGLHIEQNTSQLDTLELKSQGTITHITNFDGGTTNSDHIFKNHTTELMRITDAGDVGIGTSSPTSGFKLHVSGNVFLGSNVHGSESDPYIRLDGSGYTGYHWLDGTAYYIGQNSIVRKLRLYSGSETSGAQLNAGATSFSTYSDERLKKDITDLTNGLDKISAIRAVKFKYKTDADDYKTRIGVIAQSLVGQVDEALDLSKLNDTDTTEYYDVRYQDLIPVLVKGMQEQQTQIEELKAEVTALKNQP